MDHGDMPFVGCVVDGWLKKTTLMGHCEHQHVHIEK
jgi:hypothetical protein